MTAAPPVRPIAVFRALQLGDLLCAIPAIRALRQAGPAHRLTLIGLPWAAQLLERYPAYLDDFIAFPGWPGVAERGPDPGRAQEYQWQAAHRRFDLAVQMHGDGSTTNAFVAATPARAYAGFAPTPEAARTEPARTEPGPKESGDKKESGGEGFLPYPRGISEVERLLSLSAHLGAKHLDPTLEFPVFESERADAARVLTAVGASPGAPYVCIHPGGRGADRRWPAARFAAIADAIVDGGYQAVITGSEIDRPVNEEVRARVRASHGIVDLTGSTSVGTLAALIEGTALLVTNDTAPSHLAAALRVPSVVIFTGSDRRRWAPANGDLHRTVGDGRPDGALPAPVPGMEEVVTAIHAGLTAAPRWTNWTR